MIRFGPAGNSESFYEQGYKASVDMPLWLANMGLNAYEYQCGNGVRITEKTASELGKAADSAGVQLSVHAPYYISLSSIEEEKREKSIQYILATLKAANAMGANRIVVHSGSCGKISREEALELAKGTLKKAVAAADEAGYSHIHICPETMGKINQLGTLDEVMELCSLDERLLPTIDFGHLYTRTLGGYKTKEDFIGIFDTIENKLGSQRAKSFHVHFSRIEFTQGGEKMHRKYSETEFGPDFDYVAEILAERLAEPVIICESNGTMAEDALKLKEIYESCIRRKTQ